MGTRIFCDNCGNTARVTRYFFGAQSVFYEDAQSQILNAQYKVAQASQGGMSILGGQSGLAQARSSPIIPNPTIVELCDHCGPGWLTRVANLTKQSDEKNV